MTTFPWMIYGETKRSLFDLLIGDKLPLTFLFVLFRNIRIYLYEEVLYPRYLHAPSLQTII